MDHTTIRISLEAEAHGNRRGVLINDSLSHHIDESEIDSLLNKARRGLWRSIESEGREIGQALYRMFNGSGAVLGSMLAKSFAKGGSLVLDFALPFELDALPVELLFDQGFLLLKASLHIIRQVSDRNRLNQPHIQKRPLKMLFMACSPLDLQDAVLQYEKEEETILNNLEGFQVETEIEDSGSLEGLEQRLIEAAGFDIVHITGHAGIDPELGPVFYMEDDSGHLDQVTPERLWNSLRDYPPRLLFLSGCSTGKSGPVNQAESFAHRLVEAGLSTVLGWGLPVSDSGATRLTGELYRYLAQGKAIDFAVKRAREVVMKDGYHTWPLLRVFNDG
ncbi:MAG: CHAT domain-containing protein, partial [Methylococcales bacterium]